MLRYPTGGRVVAEHIRESIEEAGRRAAEAAREVGERVAAATDEKTNPRGHTPARAPADVRPGMPVLGQCGARLGTVEHLDGTALRVSHPETPDGKSHRIPLGWIAGVDGSVHLAREAADVLQGWRSAGG